MKASELEYIIRRLWGGPVVERLESREAHRRRVTLPPHHAVAGPSQDLGPWVEAVRDALTAARRAFEADFGVKPALFADDGMLVRLRDGGEWAVWLVQHG